ncbi:MAG: NRDE family protein [Dokdonella sp.]
MCLLLVAIDVVPDHPLFLLGNRDEFHARPSDTAATWADALQIVGGRDRIAGGTWLGIRNDGRFASVTNLRNGRAIQAELSRGALVRDWLLGDDGIEVYLDRVLKQIDRYAPFNLVVGTSSQVGAIDGATATRRMFESGIHVISNGPRASCWPKAKRLKHLFRGRLASNPVIDGNVSVDSWLSLLGDMRQPADTELPDSGIDLQIERMLAPIFISGNEYGTRASTLVTRRTDGYLSLDERSFGPVGIVFDQRRWTSEPESPGWLEV